MLARRLARLSDGCRACSPPRRCSVASSRSTCCARRWPTDEDELIAALEEARDAQLVVELDRSDAPAYGFTHALVRQTLYSGSAARAGSACTPARRRRSSRSTASQLVAALALHHRLAGSAGDPPRRSTSRCGPAGRPPSGSRGRRRRALGRGGRRHGAGRRARARARGLLVALADLMVVVGDLGRQIAYLEQALALYEALGDDERAAQAHSRLGMAHSLIDSIYAEHLDIGRAFRHFDAARPVLDRGPPAGPRAPRGRRRDRAHLRPADPARPRRRRRGDGDRRRGRRRGCCGRAPRRRTGGTRSSPAACARASRCSSGRSTWPIATGGRSSPSWARTSAGSSRGGSARPDEAQAYFERPLRAALRRRRRLPAADRGRDRALPPRAREIEAARRLLSDAKPTWITHSLEPLLDLWDGDWDAVERAGRADPRDEPADRQPLGRVGVAAPRGARPHAARRAGAPAVAPRGRAGDRRRRRRRYFELWVRPDLARALAELGRVEEAREHDRPLPRDRRRRRSGGPGRAPRAGRRCRARA